MSKSSRYFDPVVLSKLSNLSLKARFVVEGVLSGLHDSPFRGFSVEFYEHKEYSPGDDLRRVDWKAYGKFDRYFVKEYEEETNLRCFILLDCSGSMGYGSNGVRKFDYAALLAASLSYLMLKQQDNVGLITFSEEVRSLLPPRSHMAHMKEITDALEATLPRGRTSLSRILPTVMGSIKRRSLIILISDLFDDPTEVVKCLKRLRYRKNEVMVFHILDKDELEFPFKELTLFEDMELETKVMADPAIMRREYLKRMEEFIRTYEKACNADYIDYAVFKTDVPLDRALLTYLGQRRRA